MCPLATYELNRVSHYKNIYPTNSFDLFITLEKLEMSANGNTFATPLVEKAVKLNQLVFRFMYPYPFYLYVRNGIVFCKVDRVTRLKYLPFLTSIFCLTFVFTIGSCLYLPFLKLFQRNSAINIVSIVFSLFFCSFAVLECAIYYFYSKSTEMEFLINQLCLIERKCKNILN